MAYIVTIYPLTGMHSCSEKVHTFYSWAGRKWLTIFTAIFSSTLILTYSPTVPKILVPWGIATNDISFVSSIVIQHEAYGAQA